MDVQMQPRVSQSTACVAPDQNLVVDLMKSRVSRLDLRHTGSNLNNGSDDATCQQIRACVTPDQTSETVLMMPRVSGLVSAAHRNKTRVNDLAS